MSDATLGTGWAGSGRMASKAPDPDAMVEIRAATAADADALRGFLNHLASVTRRQHTSAVVAHLSKQDMQHLCDPFPMLRLSLIASRGDVIAGFATCQRRGCGPTVDIYALADECESRRDVLTILVQRLTEVEWHMGIRTLVASIPSDDRELLDILTESCSGFVTPSEHAGVVTVSVELHAPLVGSPANYN